MKEICIICRLPTEYDTETPIEMRKNYIEGAGQLCRNCAEDSKPLFKKRRRPFLKLFLALILIPIFWAIVDIKELYSNQIWWLILLTVAYISLTLIIYAGTRRN